MDFTKAIEIAPNIFWVGYVIPNDPFQCHVYLIKNGNESILIDPGSMITFPIVLEKIMSITSLKNIKYIIMHHQDPDIVSCYSTLEKIMPKRDDRKIVTHWRTKMLLKHYQWKTPFYLVDQNNWTLKTEKRELEFIFTPYAHFAGSICTYDKKSKIVFSSDLVGGMTPEFQLFATNINEYFEYAKLFHQHYIPSKDILNYALNKIENKNPSFIAPQHGSIIKKKFIKPLFNKLKKLDCGIYLMDDYITNIDILVKSDDIFKKFLKDTISLLSTELVIKNLFKQIKNIISSLEKIIICSNSNYSKKKYIVEFKDNHFHEINEKDILNENFSFKKDLINEKNKRIGTFYIKTNNKISTKDKNFLELLLKQIALPLGISLEKEITLKDLEIKNKALSEKVSIDSLTGLYNREFMKNYLIQKINEAKRYNFSISIAMIDIDFFKKINDNYGHLMGDCVLKQLSNIFKTNFRGSDVVTRYGGEEFLTIMPFTSIEKACEKMNRIRKTIEEYTFCGKNNLNITISIGVYEINLFEDDIETAINKADNRLYYAKENGRNKLTCE